jgi:hypothetical protein
MVIPEVPIALRRNKKYKEKLNLSEILDILYKVTICKEKYQDLAKEFRISKSRISSIIVKAKKNTEVL